MFTRTRVAATPVLTYRNPSVTLTVFADGGTWRLVATTSDDEVTYTFTNRLAAENAAGWLAYKNLSGLVRSSMTWHALVDAINDRRPVAAVVEPVRVRPTHPEWMARSGDPRVASVVARRRALEQTGLSDTPSARVQAERRAAREFHENIAVNAVDEWRSKAPLTERLRSDDGEAIAEFFLRCLINDPVLRSDTLDVLADLDS